MKQSQLVLIARLLFGAWMLANGANHFFLSLWTEPGGHEPLAVQLMASFVHSRLINVAMAIELVTGVLILIGVFVPLALCLVMPVSTCALFWASVLDHNALETVLALAAFALNGFLMLAYLDYYRGVLQRHAPTLGESAGSATIYDVLFVKPQGRTTRSQFVPALLALLASAVFYYILVKGRSGQWSMLVLLYPGIILHARRLHDMGHTAWLLLVPGVLMVLAFAIWLGLISFGTQLDTVLPLIALGVSALYAIWGCVGRGQSAANGYGAATVG